MQFIADDLAVFEDLDGQVIRHNWRAIAAAVRTTGSYFRTIQPIAIFREFAYFGEKE